MAEWLRAQDRAHATTETQIAWLSLAALRFARLVFALFLPSLASCSGSRGTASRGASPDIVKLLQQIKAADTDQLAVSEEDGRFLRLMAASSGAKRALEIGGANGYSAIWIGLGLRETGGRLTSIEFDPARAKAAAENIRRRDSPTS